MERMHRNTVDRRVDRLRDSEPPLSMRGVRNADPINATQDDGLILRQDYDAVGSK